MCPSARTYDNLDACMVVRSPDLVTAAALMEVLYESSVCWFSAGVPNLRPAAHMWPVRPLGVARRALTQLRLGAARLGKPGLSLRPSKPSVWPAG